MTKPRRPRPRTAAAPAPPPPSRLQTWMPYVGLGLGLLIVLAVVVALNRGSSHPGLPATQLPAGSSSPFALAEEAQPVETGSHIPNGTRGHWNSDPPSSGQHYAVPAGWGYTTQRLPPETWVHNLEHGGVAILYSCPDGCPEDVAAIRKLIEGAPGDPSFGEVKLVNAPYSVPGHRFAAVAWGWRMFMDGWDPQAMLAFYNKHVDKAPELLP